jgi:hypothetical protein
MKKNDENATFEMYPIYLLFFAVTFWVSCSTTKYIPDGQYLLDKVSLETDSNIISKTNLMEFIRQKPNNPKLGLKLYNMVDSNSSFFKKIIRKMGEPPVIFSQRQLNQSLNEMSIEMTNRGYLNARVHAVLDTVEKKIHTNYHIHEGIPYRIRNYKISLPNEEMNNIAKGTRRERYRPRTDSLPNNRPENHAADTGRQRRSFQRNLFLRNRETTIKQDDIFDMSLLEQEMNRVSNRLRNNGYYRLTTENLHFIADTALRTNRTDLTLILKDTILAQPYKIGKVKVFSGYDRMNGENYRIRDSVIRKDITIYYDKLHFLRPNVIADKVLVRPDGLYRQRAADATYSLFQTLNSVNRVDVKFKEGNYTDSTLLDCEIYLSPGDTHSIQTGLSGTNKAGDFGLALDINYGNQNLFNGSELFNVRIKSAYEFINGNNIENSNYNFYEFGISPALTFSKIHLPFINAYVKDRFNAQTQYSLGLNIQRRPQYMRNFFNFRWQFRWSGRNNILTQTLSLLDINYVFMPWMSDEFKRFLNTRVSPITRYSYEDVFIAGSAYGLIYTNANTGQIHKRLYTVRFNFESSGNTLNALFSLNKKKNTASRIYNVFGNPFAQYLKSDIDLAQIIPLSANGSVAFHTGLGIANPYNNSSILPFEKRYYAGGPNSVRGWHTRYLGPGSMNGEANDDMTLHVGDISFILSAEYRYKVLGWLEPAVFVDCGNIWTIKDYPDQPKGFFKWNRFYKELAVGTGIGLRFDFNFLILRLDAGMRVFDPAEPENKRFIFLKNRFLKDWTPYLAIGYPF